MADAASTLVAQCVEVMPSLAALLSGRAAPDLHLLYRARNKARALCPRRSSSPCALCIPLLAIAESVFITARKSHYLPRALGPTPPTARDALLSCAATLEKRFGPQNGPRAAANMRRRKRTRGGGGTLQMAQNLTRQRKRNTVYEK